MAFTNDTHAGKVALVTGASRGIGKAIAATLGAQGATVVGTATSQQNVEKINAMFAEHNIQGTGMVLDVTKADELKDVIATINSQYGAPTILVNNAGITRDNIMLRMKDEEWESIIETNLTSVYRVTKECLKAMVKARWGRIINITSVVAATGNLGQANYAAAKAGMIGFTKSLAQEIASRNITVNAVAPGFIATEMTDQVNEKHRELLLNAIPMKRMGEVSDIANAVAFLASPEASYITGETLHVNGGMYMS